MTESRGTLWVTLNNEVSSGEVKKSLQGLGLWPQGVTNGVDVQTRGFQIQAHSSSCSLDSIRAIPGVAEVFTAPSSHPKIDQLAGVKPVIRGVTFQESEPVLMAGPCSIESEAQIHKAAESVADAGGRFLRGGAFKPRSSPYSFTGLGERALKWIREAADQRNLGVITEVMSEHEVSLVAEYSDILQIGTRNMQNFALLRAVGACQMPVLLKRGMSATVEDWLMAGEHLMSGGAEHVLFCERGIVNFDAATRNLLDLSAVALMKHVYGHTVVVDPSHAAGRRDLIAPLSRAAVALGIDALLVETHPDARNARSDGPQALSHDELLAVGALFKTSVTALQGA